MGQHIGRTHGLGGHQARFTDRVHEYSFNSFLYAQSNIRRLKWALTILHIRVEFNFFYYRLFQQIDQTLGFASYKWSKFIIKMSSYP